jgi:hypothetical protein
VASLPPGSLPVVPVFPLPELQRQWVKHFDRFRKEYFAQFSKATETPDGLLLTGVISSSEPDCENDVLDYYPSKAEFQRWSDAQRVATHGRSLGNLRAQHKPSVVAGILTDLRFDDAHQQVLCDALVLDRDTQRLVRAGAYSGFSLGGNYLRKEPLLDEFGEPRTNNRGIIYKFVPEIYEVSLVDKPCCATAVFEIRRASGVIEVKKFAPALAADPRLFQETGDDDTMQHCQHCVQKAAEAHEHLRKASEAHDAIKMCQARGGTMQHASTYADFNKAVEANLLLNDTSGGLLLKSKTN